MIAKSVDNVRFICFVIKKYCKYIIYFIRIYLFVMFFKENYVLFVIIVLR